MAIDSEVKRWGMMAFGDGVITHVLVNPTGSDIDTSNERASLLGIYGGIPFSIVNFVTATIVTSNVAALVTNFATTVSATAVAANVAAVVKQVGKPLTIAAANLVTIVKAVAVTKVIAASNTVAVEKAVSITKSIVAANVAGLASAITSARTFAILAANIVVSVTQFIAAGGIGVSGWRNLSRRLMHNFTLMRRR